MRIGIGIVASVALVIVLTGCSNPDSPQPTGSQQPAAPAPVAKPAKAPPPAAVNEGKAQAGLQVPMPTVAAQPPANAAKNQRHVETPCDRGEAGWKWAGNVVEHGQCVVGPCDCVQG